MSSIQNMVNDLLAAGWSQSALARELDTSQPTIHRLALMGKEPGYELGKKIENLHSSELGTKAA